MESEEWRELLDLIESQFSILEEELKLHEKIFIAQRPHERIVQKRIKIRKILKSIKTNIKILQKNSKKLKIPKKEKKPKAEHSKVLSKRLDGKKEHFEREVKRMDAIKKNSKKKTNNSHLKKKEEHLLQTQYLGKLRTPLEPLVATENSFLLKDEISNSTKRIRPFGKCTIFCCFLPFFAIILLIFLVIIASVAFILLL